MSVQSSDVMNRIAELRTRNEEFCVVTVVRTANATSAKAGAKAVVTRGGDIHGFVGGACVKRAVKQVAAEVLASGAPRLIRVKPKEEVAAPVDADGVELHKSSCPSGGTVDMFVEPMGRQPRCIVCGTSPVAAAVVALARVMGYRTVIAAAREDHERVAGADQFVDGFDLGTIAPQEADAIVVATQGVRDRDALEAALTSDADYVAMVGSRKKIAVLKKALIGKGLPATRLDRLRGPAGFDIGAIEPEEIALSIFAEMVQCRRRTQRDRAVPADSAPASA